jgi:hypothetical protein
MKLKKDEASQVVILTLALVMAFLGAVTFAAPHLSVG